jgi:hypothetical protein
VGSGTSQGHWQSKKSSALDHEQIHVWEAASGSCPTARNLHRTWWHRLRVT